MNLSTLIRLVDEYRDLEKLLSALDGLGRDADEYRRTESEMESLERQFNAMITDLVYEEAREVIGRHEETGHREER